MTADPTEAPSREAIEEMCKSLFNWGFPAAAAALRRQQQEVEKLLAQLPDEMKYCTILFIKCEKGHGRLTATNWIDHGCQQCEIAALHARLERASDPVVDARNSDES